MKIAMIAGLAALATTNAFAATTAVEYVKICSVYGAGFHYVPGTDTCLQEATGITKRQTEDGVVEGRSELARRVKELEAKLAETNAKLESICKVIRCEQ